MAVRIALTSVMVDDQDKALAFYTNVLGFMVKRDIPMGGARWLTLVSPADPGGVELLLEPMGLPAAQVFQKALFAAGIPLTAFAVDDIRAEHDRLQKLGVAFRSEPQETGSGPVTATFEDTCGNLIQIFEPPAQEA